MEKCAFTVLVEYRQPSYEQLKQAFDCVYDRFQGREFRPIDICKNISLETREIAFELVHIDDTMWADAIQAKLSDQGLRPALYEELLAFAAKFPEEQKKYPIHALGSWCDRAGDRHSPFLDWHEEDGRLLLFGWTSLREVGNSFLAVRK